MSSSLPVSSYVDIAPNEYVTKYSLNRNFEKLLSNDYYLYDKYSVDVNSSMPEDERLKHIQSYNKMKTYNAGEFVFYKIQKDDTKFYILSSAQTANSHKPTVRKNMFTNELYVINSEWWTIVGISPAKGNSLPIDQADMYVNDKRGMFESEHELNTDPANHPTGKLSLQDSSKLFKSFENLQEDRETLFFPSYIQSFIGDNTTYYGHMRKWDNGLLEYDLTFRLGYISSDTSGIDIISANNIVVPHRNKNYLYFKGKSDYSIFNQGSDNYAVTQTSKQVNLNTKMNAYSGTIRFIEPFKDLNYMVFTTNMKAIETEAYNIKNQSIDEYDDRLIIDGLAITGTKRDAIFIKPCEIPSAVVNIKREALEGIRKVDSYPLVFSIDPFKSQLMNIDENAFANNDLLSVSIPASTRHIGSYAFSNCNNLSTVNFYVHDDPATQVRIDERAFNRTVKQVNIYYVDHLSPTLMTSSPSHSYAYLEDVDLYYKLIDANYRSFIGMNSLDGSVEVNQYPPRAMAPRIALMSAKAPVVAMASSLEETNPESESSNVFTIDVNEILAELNPQKSSPKRALKSSKMMFAATKVVPQANDVFKIENNQITGYDSTNVDGNVGYDLNTIVSNKPTRIDEGSLSDFNQLTSLATPEGIDFCIQANSLPESLEKLDIRVSNDKTYDIHLTNRINQLCVYFAGKPSSFIIQSDGNVDALYIDGYGTYGIPPDMMKCEYVNSIYANNPHVISSHAFNGISSIANVEITCNDGVKLCPGIFGSLDIQFEDPDTHVINNYHERTMVGGTLKIIGSKLSIENNALSDIDVNILQLDMTQSIVKPYAFASADIGTLSVSNIENAITGSYSSTITLSGFMANSLNGANITQFAMPSSLETIVNQVMTSSNIAPAISAPSYMFVRGNDIAGAQQMSILTSNSRGEYRYISFPGYYNLDESFMISSCNIAAMKRDELEELHIPYGVAGIHDNVFNAADQIRELTSDTSKIDITHIYLPQTLSTLGNNCFKGLISLDTIDTDPGIQLTSIGTQVFSGCTKLSKITFSR